MKKEQADSQKQVSINDVAKLAGVSVGTVSRALNSVGYVKEETRDRIQKAAEELKYVPNRAGRILKTNQTGLIMLAIPDTSNQIYFRMIENVQKTAGERGYSILLYYTNAQLSQELKAVRLLQERMVDGLILVHFSYDRELLREIQSCGNPVVLIGMCNDQWAGKNYEFDTVSIDVYKGIYDMVTHLIRGGHRNIGYLGGHGDLEVYAQRYQGYLDALKDNGLEVNYDYIKWNDYTVDGGYSSGRVLFQMKNRPTAICASNDLQAIGCWQAIRDLGGSVPGDIALTGMDNLEISKILNITSLDIRENTMGLEAARHLMGRICDGKDRFEDIYLKPDINIRESSIYQNGIKH